MVHHLRSGILATQARRLVVRLGLYFLFGIPCLSIAQTDAGDSRPRLQDAQAIDWGNIGVALMDIMGSVESNQEHLFQQAKTIFRTEYVDQLANDTKLNYPPELKPLIEYGVDYSIWIEQLHEHIDQIFKQDPPQDVSHEIYSLEHLHFLSSYLAVEFVYAYFHRENAHRSDQHAIEQWNKRLRLIVSIAQAIEKSMQQTILLRGMENTVPLDSQSRLDQLIRRVKTTAQRANLRLFGPLLSSQAIQHMFTLPFLRVVRKYSGLLKLNPHQVRKLIEATASKHFDHNALNLLPIRLGFANVPPPLSREELYAVPFFFLPPGSAVQLGSARSHQIIRDNSPQMGFARTCGSSFSN